MLVFSVLRTPIGRPRCQHGCDPEVCAACESADQELILATDDPELADDSWPTFIGV